MRLNVDSFSPTGLRVEITQTQREGGDDIHQLGHVFDSAMGLMAQTCPQFLRHSSVASILHSSNAIGPPTLTCRTSVLMLRQSVFIKPGDKSVGAILPASCDAPQLKRDHQSMRDSSWISY